MKRFLLMLLTAVTGILLVLADARADYSAIYGTYIDYNGGSKIGGPSITGYYSTGNLTKSYSFGLSFTSIEYSDNYTSTLAFKRYGISNVGIRFLNQIDVTALYSVTNELLKNHTFSFGVHYIATDDNLTNNGLIFYFDGTYFKPYNWNAGIETAFSYYPESLNLHVLQVVPHLGKYFYASEATFYAGTKLYYITLNKSDELGLSGSNFLSAEVFLHYYKGKFDAGISAWKGEQVFAVKNGGFVVYNLAEKYKQGISVEAGYYFAKNYRLGATISLNKFDDLETGNDVTQTAVTISLGYKW
ncbi:hypothetical protein [Desulfurobacterium sp.]|uniref:hypothetical protein n=1 Tax=Desulfurobacterium sp. TaxID=2004706 RepID=UPI002633CD50|nr:hypothetical protein [Desulfurobacterium sp.]